MAATTTASAPQEPISRQESEPDNTHVLDVSVFKELARKALIDALNSVRLLLLTQLRRPNPYSLRSGEWRKDFSSRPLFSQSTWSSCGGVTPEGPFTSL